MKPENCFYLVIYLLRLILSYAMQDQSFIKTLVISTLMICSKTKIDSELEFIKKVLCDNDYLLDVVQCKICAKIAHFSKPTLIHISSLLNQLKSIHKYDLPIYQFKCQYKADHISRITLFLSMLEHAFKNIEFKICRSVPSEFAISD